MESEPTMPYELIVAMTPDGVIGVSAERIQRVEGATLSGEILKESRRNNGITNESVKPEGIKQKIPWNLPEDMRIFREKTADAILVMGRKTFESLPNGPLRGRIHVVVTRTPVLYTPEYIDNDSVFFVRLQDVDDMVRMLLDSYPKSVNRRVFVCGGADIYAEFLNRCKTLHITYVHKRVEGPNVTALDFRTMMDIKDGFVEIEGTGRLISNNVERMEYEHKVLRKIQEQ